MFTLLDRQLIRNYLKAYVICLVSLLSLFVVVDLFNNLEDFTQGRRGLGKVVHDVGIYYGYKIAQIFDRLCEAIVLLAAMFTVAWIQRNNEQLPVLSAGVSTRRMIRPVLFSASAMVSLALANQEFVLPNVDNYVIENRRDMEGKNDITPTGAFDLNGTHINGKKANRSQQIVRDFTCVINDTNGVTITQVQAKEARYVPPGDEPYTGGWILTGTSPAVLDPTSHPECLEMIVEGKFFLKSQVDFETIIRQRNWWMFMPTWQLFREISRNSTARPAMVAVLFHKRLTRPLLGLILVFLGLSVILRDQNRNVFISAGLCLLLCALFFLADFFCKYLGDNELFSPALSAWMPVLIFGPLSFVMFDAIHT
jgi:lipopolysaccharide export system permease protein